MKNCIVPLLFVFGISHCQKNEATLYDNEGNSITVSLSSDLKWKQFDQKATSVCVSGLMLLYSFSNFLGLHSYVYDKDKYCINLKPGSSISSVRYPGFINDLKNDSITLYLGRDFTDQDKRVLANQFSDEYATSLIVTGGSSWTVFSDSDFQGNSVCLMAPNSQDNSPAFLASATDIPGFGSFVGSGKKGCDYATTNTFDLFPAAKHGP